MRGTLGRLCVRVILRANQGSEVYEDTRDERSTWSGRVGERMEREAREVARLMFKTKVLAASGQDYENVLVDVLQRAVPGFRPIKPQGSKGDRSNDGYVRDEGRYWQVYAPEDPTGKGVVAAAKAAKDFTGLLAFWEPIASLREYYFAHNDKYRGAYPEVEQALAEIKSANSLEVCEPFLAKDLEKHFLGLGEDDLIAVVGIIPDPQKLGDLDYGAVGEVLGHLLADRSGLGQAQGLTVPDWNEKIKFNGLTPTTASILATASYQVGTLETYFRNNSDSLRDEVMKRLQALYTGSVERHEVPSRSNEAGDLIFFEVLDQLVPNSRRVVQTAAVVIMAYFFEACDIFERPDADAVSN